MKLSAVILIIGLLVLVFFVFGKGKVTGNTTGQTTMEDNIKVKLQTSEGDIVIQMYDDMPITTGNFIKLVNQGFYDGVLFHRVIDGFMIQGGDPLTKDPSKEQLWGTGGPGYNIKDEFTHAGGNKNNRGTISMANSGPNTGGSQFFINTVNNTFLDTKHPAFGFIDEKSMKVVDKISKVETDYNDKPLESVKIIKASVI